MNRKIVIKNILVIVIIALIILGNFTVYAVEKEYVGVNFCSEQSTQRIMQIVGYILLSKRENKKNGYKYRKELDIDAMGVLDTYRNQGIGYELLEYIKKYAKEHNYTDLRLTVNEENENARHLYEKVGFKIKNIAYSMKINN